MIIGQEKTIGNVWYTVYCVPKTPSRQFVGLNHSVNIYGRRTKILHLIHNKLSFFFPKVERVHVLFEGADVPPFIKALNSPGDWKIAFYQLGRRMRYKDAFEYASKNLLHKNVLVMNADCYVDKGFEHLDERILSKKTMYALTRHESPESVHNCGVTDFCGPKSKYIGSHDAFLFRPLVPVPSRIMDSLDYRPNIVGIERLLMLNFRRYGNFTIKNPCKILHIVHHHCSGLRDKKERFVKGQRMDQYLKLSVKVYGREIMAPFSGL